MSDYPNIASIDSAIVEHSPAPFRLTKSGELSNTRFVVKDLFAIKGVKNSAGNPDWLANHPAALKTASSVNKCLNEGAEFSGLSLTDELAYSLEGNNPHVGIIENPVAPGCYTGGSSTGSAALVASKHADIGLGTDTGGSIRVPASFCGLYGFRPSINTIDKDGLIPLAPDFDTVGLFTRSAHLLQVAGNLLLNQLATEKSAQFTRGIILTDFFALVDSKEQSASKTALENIQHFYNSTEKLSIPPNLVNDLAEIFRILQGRNAWLTHRAWLETEPKISPKLKTRFAMAKAISDDEVQAAKKSQGLLKDFLDKAINPDATLIMPTTPITAPVIGQYTETLRKKTLQFTALAGLAGWPQCHLPLNQSHNKPSGLSLIKRQYDDRSLLAEVVGVSNA